MFNKITLAAQNNKQNSITVHAALNTVYVLGDTVGELSAVISVVDSNNNTVFSVVCEKQKDVYYFAKHYTLNVCSSITVQAVMQAANSVKAQTASALRKKFEEHIAQHSKKVTASN